MATVFVRNILDENDFSAVSRVVASLLPSLYAHIQIQIHIRQYGRQANMPWIR
jgi:hypothetical protein